MLFQNPIQTYDHGKGTDRIHSKFQSAAFQPVVEIVKVLNLSLSYVIMHAIKESESSSHHN